jgi:hypothetical protein
MDKESYSSAGHSGTLSTQGLKTDGQLRGLWLQAMIARAIAPGLTTQRFITSFLDLGFNCQQS